MKRGKLQQQPSATGQPAAGYSTRPANGGPLGPMTDVIDPSGKRIASCGGTNHRVSADIKAAELNKAFRKGRDSMGVANALLRQALASFLEGAPTDEVVSHAQVGTGLWAITFDKIRAARAVISAFDSNQGLEYELLRDACAQLCRALETRELAARKGGAA